MTPSEFKAWFEGFSEAVLKAPTEQQWDLLKQKVQNIVETFPFDRRFHYPRYNPTEPYCTETYLKDEPAVSDIDRYRARVTFGCVQGLYDLPERK